jgi:arsenate reductase (thioredoxin)
MVSGQQVVFVCEHGSAKSVVAAAHFNRLAGVRDIGLRAVSRGTNPDDEVAPGAVRGLEGDGLAPDSRIPQRLSPTEVAAAALVVAFCPLPAGYGGCDSIEVWDDVPPVSEDYERARDRLLERLGQLLDRLVRPDRRAAGGPDL